MHDGRQHYKVFPLCFKMADNFENLDHILHDWANDHFKKSIVEALNRCEKHSLTGRKKINQFLFKKIARKNTTQSTVERDY